MMRTVPSHSSRRMTQRRMASSMRSPRGRWQAVPASWACGATIFQARASWQRFFAIQSRNSVRSRLSLGSFPHVGRGGMTIKTIVAAIALENGDEPVARRAIQLAAEHEARLILVHAIESLPAFDPDLPSPAKKEAISEVLAAEAIASLKERSEERRV